MPRAYPRSQKARKHLGELAHIGRLYVGRCIPRGKDSCAELVGVPKAKKIAAAIARAMGGAATVFPARGIWKGTREPTFVVETITSASVSCAVLKNKLRKRAAWAANAARQDAILATTQCAGGEIDAEQFDRKGNIYRSFSKKKKTA